MVAILLPPPASLPDPLFYRMPAGSRLVRIYSPGTHGVTALTFRAFGPKSRFDHQRGRWQGNRCYPDLDADRRIYYAALTLTGCLVECFGDTGLVVLAGRYIAVPTTIRELVLLDLRGPGAMRAGANTALAKVAVLTSSACWGSGTVGCRTV